MSARRAEPPPGWRCEVRTATARNYSVYRGPNGVTAPSLPQAWRIHDGPTTDPPSPKRARAARTAAAPRAATAAAAGAAGELLLDRLLPPCGERLLVDLELASGGHDSSIVKGYEAAIASKWVPGTIEFDRGVQAITKHLDAILGACAARAPTPEQRDMVCLVAVATLTLVDLAQFEKLLAPGRMELFAQPEALRAQLLEWKAGHAAAGEPYFRCRFAPNPQGQFVEQDELKRPAQGPILSQLGRLAPAAASAAMRGELGAFTRWMAKSVSGLSKFTALKVGAVLQHAGGYFDTDGEPELGPQEGAFCVVRALLHEVHGGAALPSWLSKKELDRRNARKASGAEVRDVLRAAATLWAERAAGWWAARRAQGDGAERWEAAVQAAFLPPRLFLQLENMCCEVGRRQMRAAAAAAGGGGSVVYTKPAWRRRGTPKSLENLTLLSRVPGDAAGRVLRRTGVTLAPENGGKRKRA